jgi:hypothetical protein
MPRIERKPRITTEQFRCMEYATLRVLEAYEIDSPPILIERMLQIPIPALSQPLLFHLIAQPMIDGVVKPHYTPKVYLAQLLAVQIGTSDWGRESLRVRREWVLDPVCREKFGRILMMPAHMMHLFSANEPTDEDLHLMFDVPVDQAALRLGELALYHKPRKPITRKR